MSTDDFNIGDILNELKEIEEEIEAVDKGEIEIFIVQTEDKLNDDLIKKYKQIYKTRPDYFIKAKIAIFIKQINIILNDCVKDKPITKQDIHKRFILFNCIRRYMGVDVITNIEDDDIFYPKGEQKDIPPKPQMPNDKTCDNCGKKYTGYTCQSCGRIFDIPLTVTYQQQQQSGFVNIKDKNSTLVTMEYKIKKFIESIIGEAYDTSSIIGDFTIEFNKNLEADLSELNEIAANIIYNSLYLQLFKKNYSFTLYLIRSFGKRNVLHLKLSKENEITDLRELNNNIPNQLQKDSCEKNEFERLKGILIHKNDTEKDNIHKVWKMKHGYLTKVQIQYLLWISHNNCSIIEKKKKKKKTDFNKGIESEFNTAGTYYGNVFSSGKNR
jgi:hypothetical protein